MFRKDFETINKFDSCSGNFKVIIQMFIVHFHENISALTNTFTFSINYTEAIDSKSINTLTTNIPHHIETRQLVCTGNQLTGFDMGTLIVNGLKRSKNYSETCSKTNTRRYHRYLISMKNQSQKYLDKMM